MGGDHFEAVASLVRRFQRGSKGARGTVLEREERDLRPGGLLRRLPPLVPRGGRSRPPPAAAVQAREGLTPEAPSAARSWKAASDRSRFLPGDLCPQQ